MATDLGTLKYSLLLDNAGLAGGLTAAKSMLSQQIPEMGKFFDGLSDKSSNMQKVAGVAALGVAVGVGAIAASSIHAAANFQTMTTTLVTTAGESKNAIDSVRKGMLDISTQTGTDVENLNTALYTIESAGYHGANGLTILRAAAEGAKTENADLGKVADAVTSAMRDYHEPADQAANVTSKLVAAVGAGKSTFEGFTGALHNVLPVASAAHVSMDDVLGSIASMTVHGMSADQATQDLAHSIGKMMSPTQQMTSELSQLGINSSQLSDDLGKKGISGTLDEISDAIMNKMGPAGKVMLNAFNGNKVMAKDAMTELAAMPPALQKMAQAYVDGSISAGAFKKEVKALPTDQANLMTQFEGLANHAHGFSDALKSGINTSQSYAQALQKATGDSTTMNTALLISGENANYTKGAVDAVGKAHAEAGGHVEGWAYIQQNFNQQQSQAKEALKNTSIAIGSALLPMATNLMKVIANIVMPIAEWIEKNSTLATVILGVVGGLATLVATVLLTAKAVAAVSKAADLLGNSFIGTAAKAIGSAIATAAGWVASAAASAAAWIIANAVMLGGILLIVAIIAVAVYEIVTHWNTIKKWFTEFATWVVHIWQDTWNGAKRIIDDIVKGIKAGWEAFKNFFVGLWQAVEGPLKAIGIVLLAIMLLPLVPAALAWRAWHTQIIAFFQAVWDFIVGLWSGLVAFFTGVINGVKAVFSAIVGFIVGIYKAEWNAVVAIWNFLAPYFKAIIDAVIAVFKTVVGAIGGAFQAAWNWVVGVWNAVVGFFAHLMDSVVNAIKAPISGFGSMLYNAGKDLVNGLVKGIGDMAGHAMDAVKNIGKGIEDTAKKILKIFSPSKVFADIGQNVSLGMAQGIGDTAHKAIGATQDMAQGVIGAGNTVPGQMAGSAPSAGNTIYQFAAGAVGLYTKEAVDEFFNIGNRNTQLELLGGSPLRGTSGV